MDQIVTPTGPVWEGERALLIKALLVAQKAAEAVVKASTNPAFKSRYADLAAVVEAVVPALNAAGVVVIQSPWMNGDTVMVTTILAHESGSTLTDTLPMRPTKPDPQGVGSAITYARRYALLSLTGAAPEDDDGNAASVKRGGPDLNERISQTDVDDLVALMDEVGADRTKFLNYLRVPSLAEMPKSKLKDAIASLEKKRTAA